MDLDELYKHGQWAAKHLFDEIGELQPMWLCITADSDKVLPVMVPMYDKDLAAEGLRHIFKEKKVIRYVSIIEAWMLDVGKGGEIPPDVMQGGSLKDHPNRIEIVNVEASDGFTSKLGHFVIIRDGNTKPKLSKFKDMGSSGTAAGRFVNLISHERGNEESIH